MALIINLIIYQIQVNGNIYFKQNYYEKCYYYFFLNKEKCLL